MASILSMATRIIKTNAAVRQCERRGIQCVDFLSAGNEPIREAIHTAFLYHAIKAGYDRWVLSMPDNWGLFGIIPAELLRKKWKMSSWNRRADATERLVEFAENFKGQKKEHELKTVAWPR